MEDQMGQFHSAVRANFPEAGQAHFTDIWYETNSGQTFWADAEGNLHNLLDAAPYPVAGVQGLQGPQGLPGESFPMEFPTETEIGGVVSTTPYGNNGNGSDTGRVVTGIEKGIGHEFKL
jgi:hypothetical protein